MPGPPCCRFASLAPGLMSVTQWVPDQYLEEQSQGQYYVLWVVNSRQRRSYLNIVLGFSRESESVGCVYIL